MTIPRLELAAAALAVQLNSAIIRELELEISETTYWTDSTIVCQPRRDRRGPDFRLGNPNGQHRTR